MFNGVSTFGAVADYLGMLETVLEHYDKADRYFDQALSMHERLKAPFFLARTQVHRAQLLRRRGAPPADPELGRLLTQARALANQYGYRGIERSVDALTR